MRGMGYGGCGSQSLKSSKTFKHFHSVLYLLNWRKPETRPPWSKNYCLRFSFTSYEVSLKFLLPLMRRYKYKIGPHQAPLSWVKQRKCIKIRDFLQLLLSHLLVVREYNDLYLILFRIFFNNLWPSWLVWCVADVRWLYAWLGVIMTGWCHGS